MILVSIPGEPVAQGRGRAVGFMRGNGSIGARVFDPTKSRNWKAMAQDYMRQAMQHISQPLFGPVQLHVVAVFSLPRSQWKKRQPVAMQWHAKRPDSDNVLKAVKDAAGHGVLWLDDSQVADERIQKVTGAQGQAPGVYIAVQAMPEWCDEGVNSLRPLAGHCWDLVQGMVTNEGGVLEAR